MSRIPLSSIVFDAGTQIRAAIDQQVVADYADAMTEGAQFPPIVLFHDGNRHYLADGFHRFMAAQRNDWRDIDADVYAGTQQDALWFALGANRAHGKRLSEADKRRAIELALAAWPDKGASLIADQVGCSEQYVRDIRQRVATSLDLPERTRGRDGKMHPVTKPSARHEKREAIASALKAGRPAGDICAELGVRGEFVGKVRRELGLGIDKSRASVAERRDRIRQMAEQGYSSKQIAAAVGLDERTVPVVAKAAGIDIPADRVIGKSHRHDANRIVAQIVADAENLTEGADLADFTALDRAQIGEWVRSLVESRNKLNAFIRKLIKEQQKHGEAA